MRKERGVKEMGNNENGEGKCIGTVQTEVAKITLNGRFFNKGKNAYCFIDNCNIVLKMLKRGIAKNNRSHLLEILELDNCREERKLEN